MFPLLTLNAQDNFRIGFQASPVSNWVRNNNPEIDPTGGSLGLRLGAIADLKFTGALAFTGGLNLAFHQGGAFTYKYGGNFLPNSELSDEMLQTGDKPLPDGTKIEYKMHYLEIPLGLKIRSQGDGDLHFYGIAPLFTLAVLTRARGKIITDTEIFPGENIVKDVNRRNLFLGLGGGIEYEFSRSNSLLVGLLYQKGIIDFTRNKGTTARPHPDPFPEYEFIPEKSFASLHTLTLQLGLLF